MSGHDAAPPAPEEREAAMETGPGAEGVGSAVGMTEPVHGHGKTLSEVTGTMTTGGSQSSEAKRVRGASKCS